MKSIIDRLLFKSIGQRILLFVSDKIRIANLTVKNYRQFALITIFVGILMVSCRTSSRTVEKQRESIDSTFIKKKQLELKNDSAYFNFSEKTTIKDLSILLSDLNIKYDGGNNDSLTISILETIEGVNVKFKGKGTADFKSSNQKKSEAENSTRVERAQIQQTKSENLNEKRQVKIDKSKNDKKSEVKSKSVPFWIYLFVFLLFALIVTLYWFFGRPKK